MTSQDNLTGNEAKTGSTFAVGVVIGVLGLKGVLKVRPETNNPDLLSNIKSVEIATTKGIKTAHKVQSVKYEKRNLVLSLKEISDRNHAESLIGSTITTTRDQIRALDEDEFWMTDLIGAQVYSTEGTHLGTICDIVGQAGDFLEMKRLTPADADTVLLPFVKAIVPTVDIANKRIEIVNLPGLLD
ncbi:MAG: 16S rRNA processing protein RimM [Leptolyngbya sp.]|nr:16S rRNA processing protein RimM [Candidatus Melainabacteria bacterium]